MARPSLFHQRSSAAARGQHFQARSVASAGEAEPAAPLEALGGPIVIENVSPQIGGGAFAAKCVAGEAFSVEADIFKEGHGAIAAFLLYRENSEEAWRETPMTLLGNDRWRASFVPQKNSRYFYSIQARSAGERSEPDLSRYPLELELVADRKRAAFGAWYEMFPRSQGKVPGQSGTFRDCIERLDDIRSMGFDVLYLPPIHPIGRTGRKGPNNALKAEPGDTGSPWAIGAEEGGHKSIHPELGTFEDFELLRREAEKRGIELALDYALQCSPDHPYVKAHPDWFYRRPDGTIRFAENPPKKYEDIYPINFFSEDAAALWAELEDVVRFWAAKGVRIFRVDNPHTKPLKFWSWLIRRIQEGYPDVIFLSEAFTRPKVMQYLAKSGFTQSYTYFTWRNTKKEIQEYMEELTQTEMARYFRPNFFVNTPDILPPVLQSGGRAAFKMRLVLAATLSPSYGVYSGYELCEAEANPGTEEYAFSEKYEIKPRDWNQPGNLKSFIGLVNRIRRENPALQELCNLEFYETRNDRMLAYGKRTADGSNHIVTVINLDPFASHEDLLSLPLSKWGIADHETYQMKDLMTGEKYYWRGPSNYVRLDPFREPAHVFRLRKSGG